MTHSQQPHMPSTTAKQHETSLEKSCLFSDRRPFTVFFSKRVKQMSIAPGEAQKPDSDTVLRF